MRASWPRFVAEVTERLDAGAVEHGDKIFDETLSGLARQAQEEALDFAAYMAFAWDRMETLKTTLLKIEEMVKHAPKGTL